MSPSCCISPACRHRGKPVRVGHHGRRLPLPPVPWFLPIPIAWVLSRSRAAVARCCRPPPSPRLREGVSGPRDRVGGAAGDARRHRDGCAGRRRLRDPSSPWRSGAAVPRRLGGAGPRTAWPRPLRRRSRRSALRPARRARAAAPVALTVTIGLVLVIGGALVLLAIVSARTLTDSLADYPGALRRATRTPGHSHRRLSASISESSPRRHCRDPAVRDRHPPAGRRSVVFAVVVAALLLLDGPRLARLEAAGLAVGTPSSARPRPWPGRQ